MRWGLRREARGRHALGAAVTAIPAAPPRAEQVPLLADQAWSERFPDAQLDTQPVAVVAEPAPAVSAPVAPVVAPGPVAAVPEPALQQLVPTQHQPLQHGAQQPQHDVPPVLLESFTSAPPPVQAPPPAPAAPAHVVPPAPVVPLVPAAPAPVVASLPVPAPVAASGTLLEVPAVRPLPALAPSPAPDLLDSLAALAAFRPSVQAPLAPPPAAAAVPTASSTAPPVPAAPTGPRVEVGFADGTFRMLDPASSAAQALSDLVAELTSKDPGRGATAS